MNRSRRLAGAIVVLAAANLVAACSPTATTPPPATASPAPSPIGSPTAAPAARLAAALATLADGYGFTTTVTVGGQPAAQVTGRRVGGASELAITSNDVTVTYRIIPPRAWILEEGGRWAAAQDPPSTADPLAPLVKPSSVGAGPAAAGVDVLAATYPASALGLAGSNPVPVTVRIAGDGTVTFHYETTIGTTTSVSETAFTPNASQPPIVPPSPLPAAS